MPDKVTHAIMSRTRVKLVALMPVGPMGQRYTIEQACDSVESIVHYTTTDRKIIILDNSMGDNVGARIRERIPEVLVYRSPRNYGLYGGLYRAESLAMITANACFDFDVMIRMDADALITDYDLENAAVDIFAHNPDVGLLGDFPHTEEGYEFSRGRVKSYLRGLYTLLDYDGHQIVSQLVKQAEPHGYKNGDHVIGGALILNPVLIERLIERRLLAQDNIAGLRLQTDHIFCLLCKSVGMSILDFGSGALPMSVAWRSLYDSPQNLAAQGKKIIHSVNWWGDMKENDIRGFFRTRREADAR